jgi:DNA-3-methyladenine glycosylase II
MALGPPSWSPQAATRTLAAADPKLGALMTRVGSCRYEIESLGPPFASLARSILYQQLAGSAARAISTRFRARFGVRGRFPTPHAVLSASEADLRSVGLSRAKAAALSDLAARAVRGEIPSVRALHALEDDQIIERLTAVRGVGRWTVEMMLMFRLGRADVLPSTDYGVRKGFGKVFLRGRLPAPKEVLARGERWRPFRSVAAWYLWRACELD